MKQLTIVADNKIGLLSEISYILGRSRINIHMFEACAIGPKAVVCLGLQEDERARGLLDGRGYTLLGDDALTLKIADAPGELAAVTRLLTNGGVRIEMAHTVCQDGNSRLLRVRVDKPIKARRLLKPYLSIER